MKKSSVERVVKYFILMVVQVKERSERSQRFLFNSSEERQHSERSQIFPFNSGESKTVFEHSQRFSFKSS